MQGYREEFRSCPLSWVSRTFLLAFVVLSASGLKHETSKAVEAREQKSAAAAPTYEFEVATIKPAAPSRDRGGAGGFISDDTYRARNFSFRAIIRTAYGKWGGGDGLVTGGPSWLDSEMYDVTAKLDPSVVEALSKLRPDERKLGQERILQRLLADRLKLEVHTELKELPVYLLTIAKGGPKLHEAKPGDPYTNAFPYADKFAGATKAGGIYGVIDGAPGGMVDILYCFGVSTFALARQLRFDTGRVVLDKTGLTGSYDFTLKYSMGTMRPGSEGAPDPQTVLSASDPTGVPDIFKAIQQQLGLKLESGKGPVESIVIDHVERPSGN